MRKVKGYITVFLSMVLGIMLVFIMTIIECARYQTMRMQAECLMDAGLNSIFAEYHRELVRQYGMIFIDDSYGGNGSTDATKQHLLYFMNKSVGNSSDSKDITGLKADNARLDKISFASDKSGSVLRYQIGQYMKQNADRIKEFHYADISSHEAAYDEYSNRRQDIKGEIDEIVEEYNADLPEDEDPVSISNPADAVEYLSMNNAILYAFSDLGDISTNSTDTAGLISSRRIGEGYGLYEGQSLSNNQKDRLFMSYLFDRLGYYGETKNNACLNYQIEYIISNRNNDIDNIGNVMEKIFKSRYIANINHLNGCSAKQMEAEFLAESVSSVIGTPELINAVKESIILAWAYAESAIDLRILMDGNSLSINKSEADWNTSISDIPNFRSNLNSYHCPNGELSYRDYLYSFISDESIAKQNMGLMDVMEMDIRMTSGNAYFKMDNQIYQLEATVNCSSSFGKGVKITRQKSYW